MVAGGGGGPLDRKRIRPPRGLRSDSHESSRLFDSDPTAMTPPPCPPHRRICIQPLKNLGLFCWQKGETVLDEHAKAAEDWHHNAANRSQYTKPVPPITRATFAQDVLEGRTKVSQDHKWEKIAANVFQPVHRLPTMSIEETGLKEMEMMNNWQERTFKMIEEANSSWHNDKWKARTGSCVDEQLPFALPFNPSNPHLLSLRFSSHDIFENPNDLVVIRF